MEIFVNPKAAAEVKNAENLKDIKRECLIISKFLKNKKRVKSDIQGRKTS